jgi:hypothetical protein
LNLSIFSLLVGLGGHFEIFIPQYAWVNNVYSPEIPLAYPLLDPYSPDSRGTLRASSCPPFLKGSRGRVGGSCFGGIGEDLSPRSFDEDSSPHYKHDHRYLTRHGIICSNPLSAKNLRTSAVFFRRNQPPTPIAQKFQNLLVMFQQTQSVADTHKCSFSCLQLLV